MNLINGRSRNFQVHNLVQEIQVWKARFTRPIFTWVPRANNRAADCLAKSPLPHSTDFVTHSYVPSFLVQILYKDHVSSH
ncbi:putative ribonuclease H domain-containing protein [Arabidopsis thaliana]